ncbi:Mss4-like protein [Amylocarpus encephaloides]|uniref:Mss4-like protein n=1 Tax=Amylocarpus encephaloides TaxID=45428 RepID=A0A9P7YG45_9HELO|nr:Mss4-like protein [Amylocarpus encephaloides]
MSYEGGCFCNKVRLQYSGEPNAHVLCHCLDCRKISGGSYSNNIVVPEDNFKLLAGKPKTISKKADGGNEITSHFCGDCGTTLMRTGPSFPNAVVIKAGVLDDPKWPDENIPKGELFVGERVKMHGPIDGAAQMGGMPS